MLKEEIMKRKKFILYFLNSCVVTVIDTIIVYCLCYYMELDLVVSNTIGIIVGFCIDYLLSCFFVFSSAKGAAGFGIYLTTFFMGLILADVLIYVGDAYLFSGFSENINFALSKLLSIGVPFFIMYFLRKMLYQLKQGWRQEGRHEV